MNQYKLIGQDSKEYGPVTVEDVAQWIADGRFNGETEVQPEGEEDWRPLREVPELEYLLSGKAPKPAAHAELPPTLDAQPTATEVLEELADRPHTFNVGECMSQGRKAYKANSSLFRLSTLSWWGASFVAILVPLGSLLVAGPLLGSYNMIMVKRLRGEPARVGNLFDGFKKFMEMFIAYLVMVVATMLAIIPALVVAAICLLVIYIMADDGASQSQLITTGVITCGLSVLCILPCCLLWTMLSFALPLVLDKNPPGIEAAKTAWGITKHCKAKCLGLAVSIVIINILPYLPCAVGIGVLAVTDSITIPALSAVFSGGILLGILVAIVVCGPVAFTTHAVAYEKLFGPRTTETTTE